jgi:YVTN family beta-propeller protein
MNIPHAPFIRSACAALICFTLLTSNTAVGNGNDDHDDNDGSDHFRGGTSSQPLALTGNGKVLAVVNPDNDSVSFFDVRKDKWKKIDTVEVQKEPNGVAILPNGSKAFVTNTISGTVSVLHRWGNDNYHVVKHIRVGTEPYGLVLTPKGRKLYVSNSRSNSISVIDTHNEHKIKTINNVGFEPRGMAITDDGDGQDNDEKLYVTQFLALPVLGKLDGSDDSKVGKVTVISTQSDSVIGTITLNPLADTGFKAQGDAIARIPPGPNFIFKTGAYPSQLNNIAIHRGFAFVPNTGSSPNGPVRFDVNTQSLLSVINRHSGQDAGKTINMHLAVAEQTNPSRLFITVPWAIAFKHRHDEGYVISAASNIVVKIAVNPGTGAPTVQKDPHDPTRVLQIPTGKNPRGIVVDHKDDYAYVMNYVSRDVTVIDLAGSKERVVATLRSAPQPQPGTRADKIHIGKELYNTSVGEFEPPVHGQPPIRGRMSNNGWGSCSSCHPFGLSDNVVWIFGAGPRRTIPQHTDFDQTDPDRKIQRILNWSAERDEEEDFELNIRGVSGGLGLIVLADGITQDPNVANFLPLASGGRNQLKIRGVGAWDAIKAFIQFGIRSPISPIPNNDPNVIAGRQLFIAANCQSCHGGPQWTSGRVRFTPPPNAAQVVNGQLLAELRKVGTFDPALGNEVRANAAAPLGADGFVPASLLSLFAFPQTFLHNGPLTSLDQVLQNVTHRAAGTAGVDTLSNPNDRAKVIRFILSIDRGTQPINP